MKNGLFCRGFIKAAEAIKTQQKIILLPLIIKVI